MTWSPSTVVASGCSENHGRWCAGSTASVCHSGVVRRSALSGNPAVERRRLPRLSSGWSARRRERSGLDGQVVSGLPVREARAVRATIQYVHQDPGAALDPWWSIGHALDEALRIHGVRDHGGRRRRVDEMLEAVGLDSTYRSRYPHELSGGQQRRVGLARILVLNPHIVILDEPTSGLDLSVQATVLGLLDGLRKRLGLDLPVRQPRSIGGEAHVRACRHHVSRPHCRAGADRGDLCAAAASIHAGASCGGAEAGAGIPAGYAGTAGRPAVGDDGTSRLRFPGALRLRGFEMRGDKAASGFCEQRAYGGMRTAD